jgi:hypothetical protein
VKNEFPFNCQKFRTHQNAMRVSEEWPLDLWTNLHTQTWML